MTSTTKLINTSYGTNRDAFTTLDWGLFLSLALIWGSSFLFMAIGLDSFHPGVITLGRVGFGALVLGVASRGKKLELDPEDRGRLLLVGAIWVAIPFTLFPIAQQWIDSAVAGMLNGATPLLTALIATVLLRAFPGRLQVAGLLLGFVGIAAIALPSAGGGSTQMLGVILILISTLGYAVSLNMVTPLQQKYGSLALMTRIEMIALPMVIPYGLYGIGQSEFAWDSFIAVAAVGVLGTGLAFVLMGTLVGRVGPIRSSFLTYLIPVVALFLGVVFRDELISIWAVVGTALVIAGAMLASRREARQVS